MKHYFLGIDDCYFPHAKKKMHVRTCMIGVVTENTTYKTHFIEWTYTDTLDATCAALRLCEKAISVYDINAILLDGVTYAGFNLVDPFALYTILDIPIIVMFRHSLDLDKIRRALIKHFNDWRYRYKVIASAYAISKPIRLGPTTVRIAAIGMDIGQALRYLRTCTTVYPETEPLRYADLIGYVLGKLVHDDNRRR